jgi:hypothetical protein
LDKIQSCSAGRPSAIREADCTLSEAQSNLGIEFSALVGLARIISDAQDILFSTRKSSITVIEALVRIGRSDEALAQWVTSLPVHLRPTADVDPSGRSFTWAVILNTHYHQA